MAVFGFRALDFSIAATWPDLVASAASVAGCPYRGTPCLGQPSAASTDTLTRFVTQAMGAHARVVPLLVMQGDANTTVPPANADVLVRQWLAASDVLDDGLADGSVHYEPTSTRTEAEPGGCDYDVAEFESGGLRVVGQWTVHGLGHAWPGGAANRAWSDPQGPDATAEIVAFLDGHPMP